MSRTLKLNPIFTDSMVLQRDRKVPLWGSGAEGANVTVRCGGAEAKAVVSDGSWVAELPPFEAGGPYELKVESEGETLVVGDVLFGDVWLAGGQSNMEWRLIDTLDPQPAIASADFPRIRFYCVPRISFDDGAERQAAGWRTCSPEHAGEFSAVAFYYARDLHEALDVPIGIVEANWGGTSAACWMPEHKLTEDPSLQVYLDEFRAEMAGIDPEARAREAEEYEELTEAWVRRKALGLTGPDLGDYPWPPPLTERSFLRPNGLYGTMIRNIIPYGLKGFIYYQGEADAVKPLLYDKLLGALIRTWREDWNDPTLPFLLVQLPGYGCDGNPQGEDWALLRESQQVVTETVPHTGMAVILDIGDELDIHPTNKKPVGERLALAALHSVYGKDVASSGPVFQGMSVDGDVAKLFFDHVGEGFVFTGERLSGFELAGEDAKYYPAEAKIAGETIALQSAGVDRPIAVRYGWANYPNANLMNSYGLPAAPFRSHRKR